MKLTNLITTLLERERNPGRSVQRKFDGVLEYKTSTLSTLHLNYDLEEATRSTYVIAFSPDRTKVATSHGNHTVKISDCFSCKLICTLKGHPRTPWCVTFHPKISTLLASGCLGGQVRLWDLNKICENNVVYESSSVIASLTFHPADDILVISTQNKIIFYDWNRWEIRKMLEMENLTETVRLVRFLPNGSKLITGIANTSSQYCKPEGMDLATKGDSQRRPSKQPLKRTCLNHGLSHRNNSQCSQNIISGSDNKFNQSCNLNKNEGVMNLGKRDRCTANLENSLTSKSEDQSYPCDRKEDSTFNDCAHDGSSKWGNSDFRKEKRTCLRQKRCATFQQQDISEGSDSIATSSDIVSTVATPAQSGITLITRSGPGISNRKCAIFETPDIACSEVETPVLKVTDGTPCMSSDSIRTCGEISTVSVSPTVDTTCSRVTTTANIASTLTSHASSNNISGTDSQSQKMGDTICLYPSRHESSNLSEVNQRRSLEGNRRHTDNIPQSRLQVWNFSLLKEQHFVEKVDELGRHTVVRIYGEAAVANSIPSHYRLQLWDSTDEEYPDINSAHKNVIVPLCKVHNDSSIDVSQDGSCIAVFVPSEYGCLMDEQIQVISMKTETFLHCIYSRKFGPNAFSVSLSALNNFIMVGLASRQHHWQADSSQLVGQILQLPSGSKVNYEDEKKPVLNILHNFTQSRLKVSVNTLHFHPSPGMGILYGTNRGHVQHCHIAPDINLQEKRMYRIPITSKREINI